jgi:uncharacterized membrane protein YeaQ/YmgE (transglycosylase-associated protein family)
MPELSPVAQHWVNIVLIWVGFGSLAGLLARLILPLREPSSYLGTLTLGITGSAVGLLILSCLSGDHAIRPISGLGFLAATAGALGLLILYRGLQAVVPHPAGQSSIIAAEEEGDEVEDDEEEDDE